MKIVVSNNSYVYDELGGEGFARLHADPVVISSGEEALEAARRVHPDLMVLDADMPGTDGYAVTEAVKSDPELKDVRIILVLQGAISARQLQRLATCGCDDVLVYRQPGETLYSRAARLLGLPDTSIVQPVTLRVSLGTDSESVIAHAMRLSPAGIDLLAPATMAKGTGVRVRMQRDSVSPAFEVAGTVTGSAVDPLSSSPMVTVAFEGLSSRDKAALLDLALWDARPIPSSELSPEQRDRRGVRITFHGRFDEQTDFTGVLFEGANHVVFDTAGIKAINSWGARKWILFLRQLPVEMTYAFINASSTFIKHCNMVADMLGKGSVISFAAPYQCETCSTDNERVLQVSAMNDAITHDPPEFRCGKCGGIERFDEVPGRYFAFLNVT